MPRVVVTGGSGKLGQACVADLVDHGWDVVNVDRVPSPHPVSEFLRVDLTDFGQVVEALSVNDRYRGVDAVVHLAAIPAPGLTTNAATFANNMTTHLQRVRRGSPRRHHQHRVGLERDGAWVAVRHPTALHPGR